MGLGRGHMTELQSLDWNLQQMMPELAEASVPVSVCHAPAPSPPPTPHTLPLAFGHELCFYLLFCYSAWHQFFPSVSEHFLFPLQVISSHVHFVQQICLGYLLQPGSMVPAVGVPVAFSRVLVALFCCPSCLIFHPILPYFIGNKAKKDFQDLP